MATIVTSFTTINGVLVHEDRGGTETEYVSDPLGNLVQTRNSSGSKTYEAQYWPYGELQTSTGVNTSSWGFIGLLGYLTDSTTRLYVRARYFMTNFARWLTVDPLWPRQEPYGYALQAPNVLVDPSGLMAVLVLPIIGILAVLEFLEMLMIALAILGIYICICDLLTKLVHPVCDSCGACGGKTTCAQALVAVACWSLCVALRAITTFLCPDLRGSGKDHVGATAQAMRGLSNCIASAAWSCVGKIIKDWWQRGDLGRGVRRWWKKYWPW